MSILSFYGWCIIQSRGLNERVQQFIGTFPGINYIVDTIRTFAGID